MIELKLRSHDDALFRVVIDDRDHAVRGERASRESGRYPLHVDGRRCATLSSLLDEFAAALQFSPSYAHTGRGLAAEIQHFFDNDLRYQEFATGLDLFIWDADHVLSEGRGEGGEHDLEILVSELTSAARGLESHGPGYVAFCRDLRVYLHFSDQDAATDAARWTRSGACSSAD